MPAGRKNAAVEVILPVTEALVIGTNVSHLTFTGISFQHTTWYQPAAAQGYVEVQSGQHIAWPMWPVLGFC
jgi:hypothetical protein